MPHERLDPILAGEVESLRHTGTAKGFEEVIVGIEPAREGRGPRYLLEGSDRLYIRMNSNGYLGLAGHPLVVDAEETATREFGAGPGAVRFISGTYRAHVELEARLADFHARPAAVIFSSAYAAVVSTLNSLITPDTLVLSDELNHNCIINALRMARPAAREVYPHLDHAALDSLLDDGRETAQRAIIVSDGVFSMRGDYADLAALMDLARAHDSDFEEGVVLVVDDSHGVGAFGRTGRGTEEITGAGAVDILIGTLGKAFGVNGGYVAGSKALADFLREKAPMYIYSNPITVGEAAAAVAALSVVDSGEGRSMLAHLGAMTARFESGLVDRGLETIPGPHPVVPLMIRDTDRTGTLVRYLYEKGVLATGLNYPVVPKGDEEIRFQVNADHSEADIDEVLEILRSFTD